MSGGDVGSIASKAHSSGACETVELEHVFQESKPLIDGITKLVVAEGGFLAVWCDGNDVVCAHVLSGNPGLKHLSVKVVASLLYILLVHWLHHFSHAHLVQILNAVLLSLSAGHFFGPVLDRFL